MERPAILVIGGAGYIGAHMTLALRRADYPVVVLDDLSRGHREQVTPEAAFYRGDLGDGALLDAIFREHRIAAVMHFAAHSLVGESVTEPLLYWRNNLARTLELLEAMRRNGVLRFIFSSTAAIYGEPVRTPIGEDHPCAPTNPYGASKLAVERLLADCDAAFGLRAIALRYFNAAGADDSGRIGECHEPETHLIPLVLQVATGLRPSIRIFGDDYPTPDGTCLRDYVHVNDLCAAHLLALDALLAGADSARYNLGNSVGYSVKAVIERARRITGHAIPAEIAPRRPGDPAVLVADSTQARAKLGWRPRFENLDDIIESAWCWHRGRAGQSTG